jgi:hypothetical protein
MPINPNIALGVQPQQPPVNMLGQLGQLYALKAAKQEFEGGEALRDAFASGGDLNDPAFVQRLRAANPKMALDIEAKHLAGQKTRSELLGNAYKNSREALSMVNSPESLREYTLSQFRDPIVGPALKARGLTPEIAVANLDKDIATSGFNTVLKKSAMGLDSFFKDETSRRNTDVSSGAGYLQANLAREKYEDQLKYGGDLVTTTIPDPENPGQRIEIQTRRNIRGADLIPLEVRPPPMRVDISPSSATSSYQPSGGGGAVGGGSNVLATQVAPQSAPTSAPIVNGLNPNASQAPIFARPLPKEPSGTMAGYRKTADGKGLEFIPGGPADPAVQAQQATGKLDAKTLATREAAYPKVTSALKAFEAKTTQFDKIITELIDNKKGLDEITGFLAGRTDLSAMSDAGRRALSLFNTVTAKGGFSELQDMRNASPTGGALGNVSNQEGKQLIDSFGALSRTQSGDDLRKSLATAKSDLENLKTRMKEAYDMTYEYRAGRTPSGGGAGAGGVIDFGSLK